MDEFIVSRWIPEVTDDELIDTNLVQLCRVLDIIRKHPVTCNGPRAVLLDVQYAEQVVGHEICRPNPGKLASLTH